MNFNYLSGLSTFLEAESVFFGWGSHRLPGKYPQRQPEHLERKLRILPKTGIKKQRHCRIITTVTLPVGIGRGKSGLSQGKRRKTPGTTLFRERRRHA